MVRYILGIFVASIVALAGTGTAQLSAGGNDVRQGPNPQDAHLLTSMFLLDRNARTNARVMLEQMLDPSEIPSHRRGAFTDTLHYVPESANSQMAAASPSAPASASNAQMLRRSELSPRPKVEMPPIRLETLDGDVTVGGVSGSNFIVSIYFDKPTYSALWKTASLDELFSGLTPTTHVLFGIGPGVSGGDDIMAALRRRCEKSRSYSSVKPRVHFLKKQLPECNIETFPNCPDEGEGYGWLGQAVNGWGSMSPKLTAMWQDNSMALESAGDTGWLKPVTSVAKENQGELKLDLAVWGGQACDASEHPNDDLRGKAVLVQRGTCTFFKKVQNCISKGAAAVVVQDEQSNTALHKMGCGSPEACADAKLDVTAVLISYANGNTLSQLVSNGTSVSISLSASMQGEHIFGVDYRGRLREFGRIPPVGVDAVHSWRFAALEAAYYDYQRGLEEEVDDNNGLVTLFYGGAHDSQVLGGGNGITTEVDMLPWREMQDFDTMKVSIKKISNRNSFFCITHI